MNLYITLQEVLEEAKQRIGERWSMLPDKMAETLANIFTENGFPARATVTEIQNRININIYFMPGQNTDHNYANIHITFGGSEDDDDGLLLIYNGAPLYRDDSVWTILRPRYENLIALVRNISYNMYLTTWREKHIHNPWAYMLYAKEIIIHIRENSYYKVPDFDTWGEACNYGTDSTLLSFNEFLKSDYLHNYETHVQFPDNWMAEVYQNDVELNFKNTKLAMNDDEFI